VANREKGESAVDSRSLARPAPEKTRLLVEVGGARRPFMRGIMVHSLMARGVSFEDAYRTAEQVRERVRSRGVVQPVELAALVTEILGEKPLGEGSTPVPLPGSIQVTAGGRSMPFSKGILSQSLLAAALDPTDAFDAAREIELELLRRGQHQIERKDLRRLSYETLLHRFGERTAELYLTWRKYQDPERPVIILLGGTTGAGKTSLGLEVARRLGIRRVLSTDSIRQVMRIMLSPELVPAIHASSFDAFRKLRASEGGDPVVEGFVAQASIVAVGVRAILDRAVAERTSLVLDGVALVPGLIDLDAYKDVAHVIYLVVATLDEEAFRQRFESRGDRQTRRPTHRYLENLESILKIQEHFLELADRYDVPIVDNRSLDDSVLLVIRHVVETLRRRGEVDAAELL
jgi:2-phosphoglycerate kinase